LIFVITGVHEHGFDRLVRGVDDLAEKGIIRDVLIQIGFSKYEPRHCEWRRAIDFAEFEKYMDEADIIISHGGAGCIAGALERNKPTIVVPRLKRYNEHNNDHQLELASVLEKSGRVMVVLDLNDLEEMIGRALNFRPAPAKGKNHIADMIRNFLIETAKQRGLRI
jgi:UDP-N-acetylglucosamine transferase subunit ALG13